MRKVKTLEWEEFEKFIRECFEDGRVECELRLSDSETEYIKQQYPYATFEPFSEKKDDKMWFVVNLGNY